MRALVIGLDGATFTVLMPMMEAGLLPNLRQAFTSGAAGELLSTIPPVTALAWPSFMTGNNPGRHGLLGWQERLNARFERPWVSSRAVKGAKLWSWANKSGLRTCIVNVPLTYPPEPLNGVLVTGLLTPGLRSEFTYPSGLRQELLAAVPDYRIDIDVQHTQRNTVDLVAIRRFLDEALSVTLSRGKAVRWLLSREQYDLAVVVFELPDRLQHILWRPIEQLLFSIEEGQQPDGIQLRLLNCYQALDYEIGQLIEHLPQDAYLCLLSDHGFGPLNTLVHVNEWLAQQGWLAYDRRRAGRWEAIRQLGRRIKGLLPATWVRQVRQSLSVLRTLDWRYTLAYSGLPSENGIFLNVQGREPAGVVPPSEYESVRDAIIEALRQWLDPCTGQPIMKAVYRREELYRGPFVILAPDIVFEFQRGYKVSHLPFQGNLLTDVTQALTGFHEREGILIMCGPGIEPGTRIKEAHIQDVMPTLLYALGLPVPDNLDGRVLLELFTPRWQADHPLCTQHTVWAESEAPYVPPGPCSAEDEMVITEHLRGLGYLD